MAKSETRTQLSDVVAVIGSKVAADTQGTDDKAWKAELAVIAEAKEILKDSISGAASQTHSPLQIQSRRVGPAPKWSRWRGN